MGMLVILFLGVKADSVPVLTVLFGIKISISAVLLEVDNEYFEKSSTVGTFLNSVTSSGGNPELSSQSSSSHGLISFSEGFGLRETIVRGTYTGVMRSSET